MLIKITQQSRIPLFGLDFIGVLDRGSNLIEIRPTTLCNLRCGYCYANANSGNYNNEFEVEESYLVDAFEQVARFKNIADIEAHVDPYGEALLYKDVFRLVKDLKGIKGVVKASMQSNGTLLTEDSIAKLKGAGLDQINVTINSMDPALAKKLSCRDDYNLDKLLATLNLLPERGIDVVLTPVWFFGVNDAEIEKIIVFYKGLKERFPRLNKVRLGIQNYLVYKTGRKLGKVRERDFSYFYKQLRALEKKHGTKLVLGPRDFGIHPAPVYRFTGVDAIRRNESIAVEIVSPGRQEREFIGNTDGWGVKVVNFSREYIDPAKKPVIKVPAVSFEVKGNLASVILK
nr:radical SAM protein [Candidatus Sigynarchaeota archaeon]